MKSVFLLCILGLMVSAFANGGNGERLGKKVDKTVDDVSEYSLEQKEKIQKEFKMQMNALDKEISDIKVKANRIKTTASEETKKQVNDQMVFLEKQRAEMTLDFNKLQSSTGRAWDQVKSGFQQSLGTLKESFKKAKQEFQSEEKK